MKRIKTARGRRESSTRWLNRQLNDPYVIKAQKEGYRSRAAYKLLEMDERFHFLKRGQKVIDLGAAPGGWCQVALAKIGETGRLVAIDLLPIDPITGVHIFEMDFLSPETPQKLMEALGEKADVVLSDIAPNTTGHKRTDHLRIMAVVDEAAFFATDNLKPGGTFICKVFQGGAGSELMQRLKKDFTSVKHVKPPASRAESAEVYFVATGFRGEAQEQAS